MCYLLTRCKVTVFCPSCGNKCRFRLNFGLYTPINTSGECKILLVLSHYEFINHPQLSITQLKSLKPQFNLENIMHLITQGISQLESSLFCPDWETAIWNRNWEHEFMSIQWSATKLNTEGSYLCLTTILIEKGTKGLFDVITPGLFTHFFVLTFFILWASQTLNYNVWNCICWKYFHFSQVSMCSIEATIKKSMIF